MADQELKIRIKGEYTETGLKELEARLLDMKKQLVDLKSKFGTKSEWVKSEQKAIMDLTNDIKNYKAGFLQQKREEANEVKRLAKEKSDAEKQAARDAKEAAKFTGQSTALDSVNAIKQQIVYYSKLRNEVSRNSEEFKRYTDRVIALKKEYNGLKTNTSSSIFKLMEFGENLTVVSAGIFSFAQGIFSTGMELMKLGGNLSVLRGAMTGFTGSTQATKQAVDLFGTALAGNLSESEIMTLANRFLALGYSVDETAKMFDLAEEASDKFGVNIEEAMQKLLRFTETGKGRGFEQMGIDINEVNKRTYELAGGSEELFKKLEAEEQQILRTKAMLELYGKSVDDIKGKQQDLGDKVNSSTKAWEDLKAKTGEVLLVSMSDGIDQVNGKLMLMGDILESDITKTIIDISNFIYEWTKPEEIVLNLVEAFADKIEYLKIGIPIVAEKYGLITIEAEKANREVEGTVTRIKDAIINMRNLMQYANQATLGPDTTGWTLANKAWKGEKEKSGYTSKGTGTDYNSALEEAKKEFEELNKIIDAVKTKKIYDEWDYKAAAAAIEELTSLQSKYLLGSEEHKQVQEQINTIRAEYLKMNDDVIKQADIELAEKVKLWEEEIKHQEEIRKKVDELKRTNEEMTIGLTEDETAKKILLVKFEYAEKIKNVEKLYLLEKNKDSELYKEALKQKQILMQKEKEELKKIRTELISGLLSAFQGDLQGIQSIANSVNSLLNDGSETMLQKFITALDIVRQMKDILDTLGGDDGLWGMIKSLLGIFIPGMGAATGAIPMGAGGTGTSGGYGLDFIPSGSVREIIREVPYVSSTKIDGRDMNLMLRRVERLEAERTG